VLLSGSSASLMDVWHSLQQNVIDAAINEWKSSTVVPFACPSTSCCKKYRPLNLGDAENARPENDGQRKLWVWKMQEWKMTDKNYWVWKMQD